jgi:hypothetical protein
MNDMAPSLVLIGIHGAGKTTVGKHLSALLNIPFQTEIGKQLRRRAQLENPESNALSSSRAFDEQVMLLELLRDYTSQKPRIVESWHPGNLAFACDRSPTIYEHYLPIIRDRIEQCRGQVIIQPLVVSRETSLLRQSEIGPEIDNLAMFFKSVYDFTTKLVESFRLPLLLPIFNEGCTPAQSAQEIATRYLFWIKHR